MSKKKILFVFFEMPYPARENGFSIRYAPIMEEIANRHDIHVIVIARPEVSINSDVNGLIKICKKISVHRRQHKRISLLRKCLVRVAKLFPGGAPFPLYGYDKREVELFIKRAAEGVDFDCVVWVSSFFMDIALALFPNDKIVHDAVDSVYQGFARSNHRSLINSIDAYHMRRWEKYLIKSSKLTMYVSPADAVLFTDDLACSNKIKIVPNGIYLSDLTTEKKSNSDDGTVTIGYLGNMGYQPNIMAALRLKKIFDLLVEQDQCFRLLIIGRTPVKEIEVLGKYENIVVTGTVENIWDFIDKVDIFVFPMLSGAGQQNKVLEAMYRKKVVVCNSLANSGIGGVDKVDLFVCETDAEFVERILYLKPRRDIIDEVAERGFQFVTEKYSWAKIIPKIEKDWFS